MVCVTILTSQSLASSPQSSVWMMFYQLCLGLNHLHTNGVIHRDIKSLNIMMCKDGMVKIGDLGVSRQVGQETMMLQTFYGTPLYASPELCENKVRELCGVVWCAS